MFKVYYMKSLVNGDLYIGSCQDLKVRFYRHNAGYVKSTKPYRPWILLGYEEFNTRKDAINHEMFLKTGQQKERLKKKFDK